MLNIARDVIVIGVTHVRKTPARDTTLIGLHLASSNKIICSEA